MWRRVVGLVVLALVSVSGEAGHCDWQGCIEGATEQRIAACTAIIEGGNRNHDQFKAAHVIRASLYLAKRAFDLALVDANTAIQLDPDKAAPYSMRGSIHYGLGEMDQAIEDFNQAIRRDPKFIPAYSNRAHAYLAIGERELAVADLKIELELPASVKQWEGLQNLALSSVQKLTSAKELNPDPDPALNEAIVKVPLSLKLPTGAEHRGEFVLTTFKPKGPGPFPTVIVSHGHSSVLRTAFGRNRMLWSYFMQRGFAVLAPTRIGHGVSSTPVAPVDPEVPQLPAGVVPTGPDGRCDSWDFRPASEAGVAHILATIQYAATLPWVAIDNIVLVGALAGGFYSLLATATAPRGSEP